MQEQPLPPIPERLLLPVSALTRAGLVILGVLRMVLEAIDIEELPPEVKNDLTERHDVITLMERVIEGWKEFLELTDDN